MIANIPDFERIPRILRLNIAGQPVDWVSWQEAVCLYARDLMSWTVGDVLCKFVAVLSIGQFSQHYGHPQHYRL